MRIVPGSVLRAGPSARQPSLLSTHSAPVLVLGASGATGQLLVEQLLLAGRPVRAVLRSAARSPERIATHERLTVVEASLLDLTELELDDLVRDCGAVASCLGHNMTFKGLFGQPRRLVTDAARRVCAALRRTGPEPPVRYVLMNTTGVRNRDLHEPISFAQKCVIGLLRVALPPHADNEQAADFLRAEVGPDDPGLQWAAVRPDGLIDLPEVTDYDAHPSPTRSAIFDSGKTSRIQVAHFMAQLIVDDDLWATWRGQMPVIYDRASSVG